MTNPRTSPFHISHASVTKDSLIVRKPELVVHTGHALGKGSYGKFYSGTMHGAKEVGVKIVEVSDEDDNLMDVVHELALLRALSACSSYTVHAIDAIYIPELSSMYIITEICVMDLRKSIQLGHARSIYRKNPSLLSSWCDQMRSMLAVLRAFRTIHLDIKPENILVDDVNRLKLCDFGMCHTFQQVDEPWITERCAYTRWYRSPQVCVGEPYSYGADTWAMGCVLYELSHGVHLKCNTPIPNRPLFGGYTSLLSLETTFDHCTAPAIEEGEIVETVHISTNSPMQIVCIYQKLAFGYCKNTNRIDLTTINNVKESLPKPLCPYNWPCEIRNMVRQMCRFHEADRLQITDLPGLPDGVIQAFDQTLSLKKKDIMLLC